MANQMIKTNPHSHQIAHIPHGRTTVRPYKATHQRINDFSGPFSLRSTTHRQAQGPNGTGKGRIIAHKISFFDVIKLIVNFFLYFRSLNDLKCIDYEKENQHHLRTIGLAT